MVVRSSNVATSRHSIQERLEAVRQRMYGELSFQEVLERYKVSHSTFCGWLKKYRQEVLRLEREKGIPLYVLKPGDEMDKNEYKELERLRQEVADLKLINRAWEIIAELGKERYNIDLKKNFAATLSAERARRDGREKGGGDGWRSCVVRWVTASRHTTGVNGRGAGRSGIVTWRGWWRICGRTCPAWVA